MAIQKNPQQNPIMDPLDCLLLLKDFLPKGIPGPYHSEKHKLKLLLSLLNQYESKLIDALYADLGKSPFEAYATEIGAFERRNQASPQTTKKLVKTRKGIDSDHFFSG